MLTLTEVEEKFERWKKRPELDAAKEKRGEELDKMREEWARVQALADQRASREKQVWSSLRGAFSGGRDRLSGLGGARVRRRKTVSGSSGTSSGGSGVNGGSSVSEGVNLQEKPQSLPHPPAAWHQGEQLKPGETFYSSISSQSYYSHLNQPPQPGETFEPEDAYDVPRRLSLEPLLPRPLPTSSNTPSCN